MLALIASFDVLASRLLPRYSVLEDLELITSRPRVSKRFPAQSHSQDGPAARISHRGRGQSWTSDYCYGFDVTTSLRWIRAVKQTPLDTHSQMTRHDMNPMMLLERILCVGLFPYKGGILTTSASLVGQQHTWAGVFAPE